MILNIDNRLKVPYYPKNQAIQNKLPEVDENLQIKELSNVCYKPVFTSNWQDSESNGISAKKDGYSEDKQDYTRHFQNFREKFVDFELETLKNEGISVDVKFIKNIFNEIVNKYNINVLELLFDNFYSKEKITQEIFLDVAQSINKNNYKFAEFMFKDIVNKEQEDKKETIYFSINALCRVLIEFESIDIEQNKKYQENLLKIIEMMNGLDVKDKYCDNYKDYFWVIDRYCDTYKDNFFVEQILESKEIKNDDKKNILDLLSEIIKKAKADKIEEMATIALYLYEQCYDNIYPILENLMNSYYKEVEEREDFNFTDYKRGEYLFLKREMKFIKKILENKNLSKESLKNILYYLSLSYNNNKDLAQAIVDTNREIEEVCLSEIFENINKNNKKLIIDELKKGNFSDSELGDFALITNYFAESLEEIKKKYYKGKFPPSEMYKNLSVENKTKISDIVYTLSKIRKFRFGDIFETQDIKYLNDNVLQWNEVFNNDKDRYHNLYTSIKRSFNGKYYENLIELSLLKDNFKEALHQEPCKLKDDNIKNKSDIEKLGLNYNMWLNPPKDAEVHFVSMDKNTEQLKQIVESIEEDIETLRRTKAINFVDKQLQYCIKDGKVEIPKSHYSNKEKLKEFIQGLNNQLKRVWQTAELNKDNPKKSETALQTLTIKDHILQRLEDVSLLEEQKEEFNLDYTIKMWDRIPQKDIFIGNDTGCCIGMGKVNADSMPLYLLNTAFNIIEIVDNKTGKTIGNVLCYFAKDESGNPELILDNIEILATKRTSPIVEKQLRDAITQYAKNLCKSVAGKDLPILLGKNYNKLPCDDLEEVFMDKYIVGNLTNTQKIYLDTCYGWTTLGKAESILLSLYRLN